MEMDFIKKQIEEELGCEPPRVVGPHLVVKIFIRAQTDSGILISDSKGLEKYSSLVGQVISMGLACYPEERFPTGPRCKLGDWVTFRPNSGTRMKYRGHIVDCMYDDVVLFTVDDPTYIERC